MQIINLITSIHIFIATNFTSLILKSIVNYFTTLMFLLSVTFSLQLPQNIILVENNL